MKRVAASAAVALPGRVFMKKAVRHWSLLNITRGLIFSCRLANQVGLIIVAGLIRAFGERLFPMTGPVVDKAVEYSI
jgi:hypothetical protein